MNSGNGNNHSNNRNSVKRKSQETITNISNAETTEPSSFPSMVANYNTESGMIGNSIATPATVSSGAPVLPSATSRDQRSSSLLRLLGEVTSSEGNQENDVRHPQHQLLQQRQELQALRMQQNGAAMTN